MGNIGLDSMSVRDPTILKSAFLKANFLICIRKFKITVNKKSMTYIPNPNRYKDMPYRRCGKSGLLLPAVSLGLWHNFGAIDNFENARAILKLAFDNGITHFDLANNYGPPPGSAEKTFGQIFKDDFSSYRDELIIST